MVKVDGILKPSFDNDFLRYVLKKYSPRPFLCLLVFLISCKANMSGKEQSVNHDTGKSKDVSEQTISMTEAPPLFSDGIEILIPGQYRKESRGYPKNVNKKEWYQIYKDDTKGKWNIGKVI